MITTMTLCAFSVLTLLFILLLILFGLGFLGGFPRWYRDARANRLNCTDAQKTYLDDGAKLSFVQKRTMDVTRYVQGEGEESGIKEMIFKKRAECVK
jgi:hypothetical protein